MPTISDKELIKWTSILGSYQMKELYFRGKVQLSGKQLDLLINISNEEKIKKEKLKKKGIND